MLRRRLLVSGAAAVALGCSALRAHALSEPELKYKRGFRGELGPLRPSVSALQAGSTTSGPVVSEGGVLLQAGPFNSLWIRIGCEPGKPLVSAAALDGLLTEKLQAQAAKKVPGALYVAIDEKSVDSEHVQCLLKRGFKFYHHRTSDEGDEFVYYAWPDRPDFTDKVPVYATSTEGVGAILLSPDEKRVLLVWEYGCWKMPTGSVDQGESFMTALQREVGEEVGCQIDPAFRPVYVCGWQASCAGDMKINNHFGCFGVRAKSEELTIDHNEIAEAKWFDVSELLKRGIAAGHMLKPIGTSAKMDVRGLAPGLEDAKEAKVSTTTIIGLERLLKGTGFQCKMEQKGTEDQMALYWGYY